MPAVINVCAPLRRARTAARAFSGLRYALVCALIFSCSHALAGDELTWQELPPLPDTAGLGGPFVGAIGDVLIVAGGANFPDKPIWDGGKKVWYDDIYIFEPGGRWRKTSQKLPRPLAYGECISFMDRLILIGGSDAKAHYKDVLELRLDRRAGDGLQLKFRPLPPLPKTCAMMNGALVGSTIYIAGGVETPEVTQAMHTFWKFSLAPTRAAPRWRELEPWPGPQRHSAVAAAAGGTFYLMSGIRLQAGRDGKPEPASPYLSDAYAFALDRMGREKWRKIAGPPKPIAAAASPAWSHGHELFVFSGIDHTGLGIDPRKYPPFPLTIRAYDRREDRWREAGEMPEGSSRVTAGATAWRGGYVIASGEIGPSRRSPTVYWVRPAEPEAAAAAPKAIAGVERPLILATSDTNPRNTEGDFVALRDGRILYIYTHFTGGGNDDSTAHLAGRFSADQGHTWTTRDEVVLANEGGQNVMSVSLLRLADGRIALFYLRKNSLSDCRPLVRFSSDEAKTWSEPTLIIDEVGYYVLNNGRAVQLTGGRIVLPICLHNRPGQARPDWQGEIMAYLSDDAGRTWRRSKTVQKAYGAAGKRISVQEPGIVELARGRLMMFCRSDAGSQQVAYSSDGGETWSRLAPSNILSPLSPASIERIPKTGDLLLVWNNHDGVDAKYRGKRTPLCVAISSDEGKTWTNTKTLEDDPEGWFCYTAIFFTADDHVLLSHGAGHWPERHLLGQTNLVRFPVSWLYR